MSAEPRLIADRYRLDERIGSGGMGVVWRGYDVRLNRVVAVKQLVLGPGLSAQDADESRARAMREGRIAAQLQHPHAINVFDVALGPDVEGGQDSQPWLVMEYLPSRSLGEVLAERGSLPPMMVAHIGRQIADALAAAHRKGIVHRDVKPGNVLLGDKGEVKITDFGIARASWDPTVTRSGVLTGTPAYFAPEVARGEAPDPASDVFSLGSTLYSAVEGVPPFGNDDNALALLRSVAEGEVRAPEHAGPLRTLLMQLLRYDPAQRPVMTVTRDMLRRIERTGNQPPTTATLPEIGRGADPPVTTSNRPPVAPSLSIPSVPVPASLSVPVAVPTSPSVPADPDPLGPIPDSEHEPVDAESEPASDSEPEAEPERVPEPELQPTPDPVPVPALPASVALTASGPDDPRARSPRIRILAAATLLVLITIAVIVLANTLGGPDTPSTAAQTSAIAPATSTTSPTAAPSATPSTTTEQAAATTPPPAAPGPADFEQTVRDYYGLLPTQLDAAYAYLGPDVQDQSGGRGGYENFWSQYSEVEAENVHADGSAVTLTIVYTNPDGSQFTEPYVLEMGTAADGRILILNSEYGGPG